MPNSSSEAPSLFQVNTPFSAFKSWLKDRPGLLNVTHIRTPDKKDALQYIGPGQGIYLIVVDRLGNESLRCSFQAVPAHPLALPHCVELLQAINQKWPPQYTLADLDLLVRDPALLQILQLRLAEVQVAYRGQAYLAAVILLGSILEGILIEVVDRHLVAARAAPGAPGGPLSIWNLRDLIQVVHECGWVKKTYRDYSDYLREYRNLVHPRQQKKLDLFPDAPTCQIAQTVVAAVVDELIKAGL